MIKAVPSIWYDKVFSASSKDANTMKRYRSHLRFMADNIIGNSVLDLGCGMGLLADMIGNRNYIGVDFSNFCIRYAIENCSNPNALFYKSKIEDVELNQCYDTVVLSEILEHVDKPEEIVAIALKCCSVAVIGSVPIAMPMECHVTPNWTAEDIFTLFDAEPAILLQGCSNTHWHFVYHISREQKASASCIIGMN